jgi:hypothetical protein
MADIPIPFTDEEVDTDDDWKSIVVTLVAVAVGFGLLVWLRDVGGTLASQANSYISNTIGFDLTSGQTSQTGGAFD